MKRITPKDFYLDLPCSVVSIGCAAENQNGSFEYEKIRAFSEMASANDNYATLRSVNEQVRKFFKVKKYTYYTRAQRVSLKYFRGEGRAIICVLGHYLYADFTQNCYYSYFDNLDDMVVAVWELM